MTRASGSRRIVILTEGQTEPENAKTASCIIRYRPDEVIAVFDAGLRGRTTQDLLGVGGNLPIIGSLDEAPTADTLLLGTAPPGGRIPESWRSVIRQAIRRGLTIWSGLHQFLTDDPEFSDLAAKHGVQLIDVRKNEETAVACRPGFRDDCLRIHTVGHDCSVGKMVASVEITNGLKRRGVDAKFVATGQTGIMVEGDGCPIDRVISDFVAGSAENLVLKNQQHEVLVVEGQGSLVHPAYSGVTLGLLHGCAPHGLILVYEMGRTTVADFGPLPIPPLAKIRDLYELMANVNVDFACRVLGIAINSRRATAAEAAEERRRVRTEFGLPTCDVIRDGADELVDAVIAYRTSQVWKKRA